jgi:hypothetical protein
MVDTSWRHGDGAQRNEQKTNREQFVTAVSTNRRPPDLCCNEKAAFSQCGAANETASRIDCCHSRFSVKMDRISSNAGSILTLSRFYETNRHHQIRRRGDALKIAADAKGALFLVARSSPAAFIPTRDVGRVPIDVFIDVFVDIDVLVYVDIDTTGPFIPAGMAPVARPLFVTAA